MNDSFHERGPRMSRQVLTPLLIAAGVIGLPVAFSLSRCAPGSNAYGDDQSFFRGATNATEYPNNTFIAGRGYYHQPFHAWFLLPFNSYEAGRGWYRGGSWRTAALADERERLEQLQRSQAATQSGGFFSRGNSFGGSSGFFRSRPSSPSPSSSPHAAPVLRGGFGHSASPGAS